MTNIEFVTKRLEFIPFGSNTSPLAAFFHNLKLFLNTSPLAAGFFIHGDAFEIMTRYCKDESAVFFIDPPYTTGGKRAGSRLYTHSGIDREHLFSLCEKLQGDFLMTCDNATEVYALAKRHGFQTKPVAMTNTHHAEMNELLNGRDLSWVEDGGVFREEPPP